MDTKTRARRIPIPRWNLNADEVRKQIRASGYTQAALCKRIGLDPGQLSRHLSGIGAIDVEKAVLIARELGVSLESITAVCADDCKCIFHGRRAA